MEERDLDYIVGVLKGEPAGEPEDWYAVLGFLFSHRVAGLFCSRANRQGVPLPKRAERLLSGVFEAQKRRVRGMRREIAEISEALERKGVRYVLLKGSLLANAPEGLRVYEDGERASEDIDVLLRPDGITEAEEALKELGFVQGVWRKEGDILPFSRAEVLKRRMNRGETAPFVRLTGDPERPFLEVDLNFSLGNTPSEGGGLLEEMVSAGRVYEGEIRVRAPDREMFFLHLLLHQYKESCLGFMAERGKDLELYKLADLYYLSRRRAFDWVRLDEKIREYGLESRAGAVLHQVGAIFRDEEFLGLAKAYGEEQPLVTDYERKRQYYWTAPERARICRWDGRCFLAEVE